MIRVCPHCEQENRVPPGRLTDQAKCGSCKALIGPLSTPLDVAAEEFSQIVKGTSVPVLVDFWAAWCGPCRMAAPEVKRVAQQMAGRAVVLKVNTDEQPELARLFQIQGIPHFVVLKDQQIAFQQSGLVNHRQLVSWLERASAGGPAHHRHP